MFTCKYCNKECKNKNSLAQHEIRCKNNPNKIQVISNFIAYNKYRKENNIKGTNQFIKAKELNIEVPTVSEYTKKKISNKNEEVNIERCINSVRGWIKRIVNFPICARF